MGAVKKVNHPRMAKRFHSKADNYIKAGSQRVQAFFFNVVSLWGPEEGGTSRSLQAYLRHLDP